MKTVEVRCPFETKIDLCTANILRREGRPLCAFALALSVTMLMALAGCSGTASRPQVGAINFTNALGAVQTPATTLTAGGSVNLDVVLQNDASLLGADWSVSCSNQPPVGTPLPPGVPVDTSCGYFTPGHTASGPVPSYAPSGTGIVTVYVAPGTVPRTGTVTLYASASGDHSRFSSVTLQILALPISTAITTPPPASVAVNGSALIAANVSNDPTPAGVVWSATCGSSVAGACGTFQPTQTLSGATSQYIAPAVMPSGGAVTITASSVNDPSKSASATVTILPLAVSVTPTTLSVATNGTGVLNATVQNDVGNAGVDWTVSCANVTSPGVCGSIAPSHTASGAAATYTAPKLVNIAVGTAITLKATATADNVTNATATVTTLRGSFVSGIVSDGVQVVSGASVALYAANASDAGPMAASNSLENSVSAITNSDGSFAIPDGYVCPSPTAQMYLISTGGDAGAGVNPNLALMTALGPCASPNTSRIVVNEVTTVAAAFALSGFMRDASHVGSSSASPAALAAAFATAQDLVDITTGQARRTTVSGAGVVPQAKLNTLANALNACAKTSGAKWGVENACTQLFSVTNLDPAAATTPMNVLQAALSVAHHALAYSDRADALHELYRLGVSGSAFQPALAIEPADWTLGLQFGGRSEIVPGIGNAVVDAAGNVWVRANHDLATEFVGAASSIADPEILVPVAMGLENNNP